MNKRHVGVSGAREGGEVKVEHIVHIEDNLFKQHEKTKNAKFWSLEVIFAKG